jgi:hypothetical protein
MNNKKAKKSFCPRASTGNTHHGMRYVGEKLFSIANINVFGRNVLHIMFHIRFVRLNLMRLQ